MFRSYRTTHVHARPEGTAEFVNRRLESDLNRVMGVVLAMSRAMNNGELTQREFRVFSHILIESYLRPIAEGESDQIRPFNVGARQLAEAVGMDRAHVYRALRSLVSKGYAVERDGSYRPRASTVRALAEDTARKLLFRVVDPVPGTPEPDAVVAGHVGGPYAESATPPAGPYAESATVAPEAYAESATPPAPDRPRAMPEPACAREGARARVSGSSLSSPEEEEKKDPEYIYHPDLSERGCGGEKIQDDIYIKKSMLTVDEEKSLIDWCDRHLPMRAVAESMLPLTRACYGYEWHLKALKRTKCHNKPRWAYTKSIMDTWEQIGGPDCGPEDAFDDEMLPLAPRAIPPLAAAPGRPSSADDRRVQKARQLADYLKTLNPEADREP